MEKSTAIGKFGIAFFALVAFATACIVRPGLSAARVENRGASAKQNEVQDIQLNAAFANGAPFRDGLFQGKLARQRGAPARVSESRWAFGKDQSAYESGFRHAFAKRTGPRATTVEAEQR